MTARVVAVLEPGAIVLIAPSFPNPALAGCLAIVEECRAWGALAYVIGPGAARNLPPARYPVRLVWADILPTGGSLTPAEDPTAGDGHNPGPAVCRCASPAIVERKFLEIGQDIYTARLCDKCGGATSLAVASWVADMKRKAEGLET